VAQQTQKPQSHGRREDHAAEREAFERKMFSCGLAKDKGDTHTQSAEDDSAKTRQWTFTDKGSRYQVFGGRALTG